MGLFKDCGCGCNGKKQEDKLIISIISALTFFVVANPATFRFVRGILGSWIASSNGCSTTLGLIVHSIVFMLIVWGMMNIKKDSVTKKGCGCGGKKPVRKGEKVVIKPPVPMVEAPDPKPGFAEDQIELTDTGRNLVPMPVESDGTLFK